ncbi:MAG TPA: efflux RND transporter permease subunit [Gemmatimonadales bacterium]|jgi:CzcA family heavy metal efflux pump|nr:efflux RND transporter permease subunit [Gemmatimonadales bacterium]
MMRKIVEQSLRLRVLVIAAAAVTMVVGVGQLERMPVDVLPEFAPPYVEIQTEALGLSANEVEDLVTLNVEEMVAGVPWLQTMRSRSVPGLSSVVMIFQPGTDLMRARQMVQERLTLAYALPNASKPPVMMQPLSATSRVAMIGLSSKTVSLIDLSVLTRWTIKPRLLGVPGVANVAVWGDRDRQLQVQIDPERLRARGVTQSQIIQTAGNALWISPLTFLEASFPGTGGWIDGPQQRLEVRHVLPLSAPGDLAKVTVEGRPSLRLGDVANVVEGHPPLIGDALLTGSPGLLLVVEKLPGANTLEVTRGVEAALAELRPGLPGVELDSSVYRSASFIEMAFANLTKALLIAAVLGVVILGLVLYNWRAALIGLVAIPLSLVTATALVRLAGGTLNTMVLAGLVIALGVVVDEAILSIYAVLRRVRQRREQAGSESGVRIAVEAALAVRGPMLYATLILLLAVVPVFLMQGVSGTFFKPLALSYTLALVAALVVATIVTPALGLLLLRDETLDRRAAPLVRWLQHRYAPMLARTINAPRSALITAGVIAVVGLAAWPWLEQSLLPSFKERYLRIDWIGAPGTSHPAMVRMMGLASAELRSIPGVKAAQVHVGRAVTGDQVVDVNSGQLWVNIDPEADYDATVGAIQEVVDGYPGLTRRVESYLTDRIREVLAGSSQSIVVRIYGKKRDVLRAKAEEVRQALAEIDGISDLRVDGYVEQPQVEIQVNLAAAEPHGLKPGDVRRAAATMYAGLNVGFLFEAQKMYDVVVWGTPELRNSVSDIRDLLLDTPRGGHVRLGDVADVRIASSPTVIYHEALQNRIDVVADVRGSDLAAVVEAVDNRLDEVEFPVEYYPTLLGEAVEREAAEERMLGFALAVAVGILLLLQAAFRSWRLAGLFFLGLPVALAGGVVAALLDGGTISLGTLIGFLGVLALAVRHGIILIRHYQHLEEQEREPFGPALVLRGTREMFASIVITAVTTAAVMVPLIVFGRVAGLEIVHPIAVVILGGLVTATVFNLHIVPALYARFGAKREADLGLLAEGGSAS